MEIANVAATRLVFIAALRIISPVSALKCAEPARRLP
jgi:hypothetical protein